MSADELRKAADMLREDYEHEFVDSIHEADVMLAVAGLLEEVWAWREEGLGLIPDGNIGDAWLGVESRVKAVARLIIGGAA